MRFEASSCALHNDSVAQYTIRAQFRIPYNTPLSRYAIRAQFRIPYNDCTVRYASYGAMRIPCIRKVARPEYCDSGRATVERSRGWVGVGYVIVVMSHRAIHTSSNERDIYPSFWAHLPHIAVLSEHGPLALSS